MSERWHRLDPRHRQSALDGGTVVVEETRAREDGKAEVRFVAPTGWHLERIAFAPNEQFEWLANRKAADGIVLARTPQGLWEAHIVECKRSIKDKAWAHVQAQLHGSRVRLDAIAGVLGIEIGRVLLYTAYRQDLIGADSVDPILGTMPVGTIAPNSRAQQRATWRAATIQIPDIGPLPHQRLQLTTGTDDVGRGQVTLPVP